MTALLFWLAVIGGYWWYLNANDLSPGDSLRFLAKFLTGPFGPIVYIVAYIIRPLIFFPATLITILGGFLFGPIIGVLYTIIGSNSSAMLAYFVAYFFGKDVLQAQEGNQSFVQRYARRLRENSFETVLLMRLLFLPYDLVHYVAGFLRIDWRAFLLATAIGSIPGTISFVLLGASFGTLEELVNRQQGGLELQTNTLIISVTLILASLVISRLLKRRGVLQQE